MKETDIYSELTSIRSLMERSSKFISLSGLSGVMAGIYALAGAAWAYQLLPHQPGEVFIDSASISEEVISTLVGIALSVLILSVVTCLLLTSRQSKKTEQRFWGPGSKRLFGNVALPLITGGLFALILLARGDYGLVVPACLLFYGLSLVSGSHFTFSDVKWLGICQIILGLLCAFIPGYGLLWWSIGFGLLHIVYGSIMHFKYKQ